MNLFFLMIFAVYGGMHVYAFLRARSVLHFSLPAGIAIAAFMLVMIASLFIIRQLEYLGYEVSARLFAYCSYFWLAGLFLFVCGSLVLDGANGLLRAAGWAFRFEHAALLISPRPSFFTALGLSVVICAYGYFEARHIGVEKVVIETSKLPAGTERLTIAQISDVHLGLIIRCSRLGAMLEAVKAAKPDIFISSGDLVDAQLNHLPGLAELLREIKPRYGSYAITGNHEYYAGIDKALAFTREAGFRVLRNEAVQAGPITIAGVDDHTAVQLRLENPVAEDSLLKTLPKDRFTLFLKHQPHILPSTIGLFDLQMSGHTHKGQIFPFSLLVRLSFPLLAGDYDLGKGSRLHVSRGTGTWGPPIRFLSPPEVTVYEIVRKFGQ